MERGESRNDRGSQQRQHREELEACHLAASSIGTSFSDAELMPRIAAVKRNRDMLVLSGYRVTIIGQCSDDLREAIPLFVTATGANTTFISLTGEGAAPAGMTLQTLQEKITAANPDWLIMLEEMMHVEVLPGITGEALALGITSYFPGIECLVLPTEIHDPRTGRKVSCLEQSVGAFAKYVKSTLPMEPSEALNAISALCMCVDLTTTTDFYAQHLPQEFMEKMRAADEQILSVDRWRENLRMKDGDSIEQLVKQLIEDPSTCPNLFALLRGLDQRAWEQIPVDLAGKAIPELQHYFSKRN